jgi:hypothetical protein
MKHIDFDLIKTAAIVAGLSLLQVLLLGGACYCLAKAIGLE